MIYVINTTDLHILFYAKISSSDLIYFFVCLFINYLEKYTFNSGAFAAFYLRKIYLCICNPLFFLFQIYFLILNLLNLYRV